MSDLAAPTIQEFFAVATIKAADDLLAAYARIPGAQRNEKPAPTARTAQDQMLECVILSEFTAEVLHTRVYTTEMMTQYEPEKQRFAVLSIDDLGVELRSRAEKVAAAIRAVPNDDLNIPVKSPWGDLPLHHIVVYTFWNMTYHQGQINYIASMLGTLP